MRVKQPLVVLVLRPRHCHFAGDFAGTQPGGSGALHHPGRQHHKKAAQLLAHELVGVDGAAVMLPDLRCGVLPGGAYP